MFSLLISRFFSGLKASSKRSYWLAKFGSKYEYCWLTSHDEALLLSKGESEIERVCVLRIRNVCHNRNNIAPISVVVVKMLNIGIMSCYIFSTGNTNVKCGVFSLSIFHVNKRRRRRRRISTISRNPFFVLCVC